MIRECNDDLIPPTSAFRANAATRAHVFGQIRFARWKDGERERERERVPLLMDAEGTRVLLYEFLLRFFVIVRLGRRNTARSLAESQKRLRAARAGIPCIINTSHDEITSDMPVSLPCIVSMNRKRSLLARESRANINQPTFAPRVHA